jgi:oligopeptide/dipeptide ABC transporter ATP-binding protein
VTEVSAASGTAAGEAAIPAEDRKPLIKVDNLVKYYPIHAGFLRRKVGDVRAVDDVSFEVFPGEILGLVGESGCGKSTLGRTLLQLQPRTSGTATMSGEDIFKKKGGDLKKLRRRMQIIFQDPVGSLNPRMPVSDIIGEGLLAQADATNGWGKRSVRDERVGEYLEAVGLRRDYARRYPHEFSGGQRQRIGMARALALDPEFIVCDEPVSALDVSIQSQILNLLLDLRERFNLTYLFIAHNLSVVQYISDRVGVMYLGKLVELASVDQMYANPRHPYTVALLSAVPEADPRIRKRRIVLKGDVPSPAAPPSGCRFHTRCWLREQLGRPERCETEVPEFRAFDDTGHRVACHFAEEVTADAAAMASRASAAAVVSADADDGPAPAAPQAAATAPEPIPGPAASEPEAAPEPAPAPASASEGSPPR